MGLSGFDAPRFLPPKLTAEWRDFIAASDTPADEAKGLLPDSLRLGETADK